MLGQRREVVKVPRLALGFQLYPHPCAYSADVLRGGFSVCAVAWRVACRNSRTTYPILRDRDANDLGGPSFVAVFKP